MPIKRLMMVKFNIPAGNVAAMASAEYQARNIRSTNCWIASEVVLKMRGIASKIT